MKQSPSWEDDIFSDDQKIPHLLWNLNIYYCVRKSHLIHPKSHSQIAFL